MKKVNLAVAGLVALGTVAFVPSVNAAENQSGETTSSVEVKPGMLTIKEFPESIAFESQTITGKDMTAKESEESSISIEDLRGSSSKGWSLNASLKGEENFKGMALTLSPEITANGDVATSTEQTLNSKGQPIVTVADGDITKTDFDTSMKLHAKLDIPAKQLANTYSTTIVWNLTEGPGTAE
ncbi:WxL domain-containing protein [Lactococcus formosensis]|uniref:WxL domain-containing protein n=1 Tax=Lactococcus formosensis TaxID=1281486 RepID=UPI002434CCEB|nr:WxL domain-containing protein [Lactococcus formosensis]MDG6120830.1 WxL domain-containing protein [Lactococcus formosensis]